MKAPKLVIRATLPVTTSPTFNLPNTSARAAADSASTTSRRERIKRFSFGSTLILASNSWPTKRSVLRTKRVSSIEAGINPRSPSNSTESPPLTARVPLTVTTSSSRPTNLSHAFELPNVFRYKVSYCISIFTNHLTKNKQFKCFTWFYQVVDVSITIVCQFAKSQDTFDTSSRDCNVSLVRVNCQYFSSNNVTWFNLANTV